MVGAWAAPSQTPVPAPPSPRPLLARSLPPPRQPWEDLLHYPDFSIRVAKSQLPRLVELLRAVPAEDVARLMREGARWGGRGRAGRKARKRRRRRWQGEEEKEVEGGVRTTTDGRVCCLCVYGMFGVEKLGTPLALPAQSQSPTSYITSPFASVSLWDWFRVSPLFLPSNAHTACTGPLCGSRSWAAWRTITPLPACGAGSAIYAGSYTRRGHGGAVAGSFERQGARSALWRC